MERFENRTAAGIALGAEVAKLRLQDAVVLGLPRGGVPVAAEVARALHASLDVIVVRKVGVPGNPELGMGAIAEEGIVVLNDDVLDQAQVDTYELQSAIGAERSKLLARVGFLRERIAKLDLVGKTAVIVDDGIATGIDALAACRAAHARQATRVVMATPVAPSGWERRLSGEADICVALATPVDFMAVGQFYEDFSPVADVEVMECFDVRT